MTEQQQNKTEINIPSTTTIGLSIWGAILSIGAIFTWFGFSVM